ncbi:MAG: HutD family protein [Sporolactobacillus sp.]
MEQLWLKRRSACATSSWSGGETTEFFIYPESASYASRQFSFRFSSATVTQPRSTFSMLSGYYRYLIPLDQPITLHYQGHGSAHLAPLESAAFDGGWTTESVGACRDFNVMINKSEDWQANVSVVTDSSSLRCTGLFTGILALNESVTVSDSVGTFSVLLQCGDFLLLKGKQNETLAIEGETHAGRIIQCTLTQNQQE